MSRTERPDNVPGLSGKRERDRCSPELDGLFQVPGVPGPSKPTHSGFVPEKPIGDIAKTDGRYAEPAPENPG